jgi:murein L,D-transpeptidase YafK
MVIVVPMSARISRWVVGRVSVALLVGASLCVPSASGRAIADDVDGSTGRVLLQIWKGQRAMELVRGDQVVRRFSIVLGSDPRDSKRIQGDGRTPVGEYVIQEKHPSARFHLFLGLNYPNIDDAERGYREGLIDPNQWVDIFFANARRRLPPSNTRLGGQVGIHGFGERPLIPIDWTKGCVAISNEEIEYLYRQLPLGTPVIIHE